MKKEVKNANTFEIYYSLKTKVRVNLVQSGNFVLDGEIEKKKRKI